MRAHQAESEAHIDATLKAEGSSYERPNFELGRLEGSDLVHQGTSSLVVALFVSSPFRLRVCEMQQPIRHIRQIARGASM